MTLEEFCPENRSRAGTIELERWASSSVCVYVSMLSQIASMQAFKRGNYVAGPGGHAGRGRDAKPRTSHQGEVTAILHAVINLCCLTLRQFL